MHSAKKFIKINNKQARFNYQFLEEYSAGIVLTGDEVKSIKSNKISIQESYCYFINNELWIKNIYTTNDKNIQNRKKKILLKKKEINKLLKNKKKGLTIIPTKIFTNLKGIIKINIALTKNKRKYNKREDLKKKEITKEINLNKKYYNFS